MVSSLILTPYHNRIPNNCFLLSLIHVVSLWALVYDVSSGLWDDVDTDFFQSYPGICATVKGIEVHVVKGYRDHMEADEK